MAKARMTNHLAPRVPRLVSQAVSSNAPVRHAFTILELFAAIAVVALLLALLLPALTSARRTARFSTSLANHRSVLQTLAAYSADNADTHPYLVAGDLDGLSPSPRPIGPHRGLSPRDQVRYWATAAVRHSPELRAVLYPEREHWPAFRDRDDGAGVTGGSFIATATMFAAPEYFSETTPPAPSHLRPTRTAEIAFPAAKMLVYDWSSVWLNRQRDIDADTNLRQTYGFADASAIVAKDLTGPFVERSTVFFTAPGHTTTDGLRGRDR
ncbi:MAG: hypothetical protein D6692_12580 [Planctomycetota bacterium]|nr:MAG: hypothetical protein D6692_12580 [Planctomycetota bacterium]